MTAFIVIAVLPAAAWMATLGPNGAVLLATAGLVLIFLELNRPGLIVPGSVGLLAVLFAAAAITQYPLQRWALALLAFLFVALVSNLWLRLPLWSLAAAALALVAGLRSLVQPHSVIGVTWPVAAGCGLTIGVLGSFLSRVALRARRAKAVH